MEINSHQDKIQCRKEFNELLEAFDSNNFMFILSRERGTLFLKLRSLSRTNLLQELVNELDIDVSNINNNELFEFIFCSSILDGEKIDEFIRKKYSEERKIRIMNEDFLYSQLYKLKVFDWGGFYQNSVEQTIVNNYIKKIQDFDKLNEIIEKDINPRLKGYILCSWYNHWTSILIEDMFKDHPDVLPTIGLIKKVDFFWKNLPFDLKVTYFPEGFMDKMRKEKKLKPEFAEIRNFAKKHNISYDENQREKEIFDELWTKISEDISEDSKNFIKNLKNERGKIIRETQNDPKKLIQWLYEEQGIRRFDAADRFFLVLINLQNLEESWKLKRNKKLLQEEIKKYLDSNKTLDTNKLKITFKWGNKSFTTYAAILFIIV